MSTDSGEQRRFRVGGLIALFVLVGLAALVGVWIRQQRVIVRQMLCESRLNQLHLAFYNYHDEFGSYPPAYVSDANGVPMHSWRVLILPYIDHADVYNRYDFTEPWDGPNNRTLARECEYFYCPNGPHSHERPYTDYVVIVGPDTAFPPGGTRSMEDITDGKENTILIVEAGDAGIHWMEPRDLSVDEMSFVVNDATSPSISSSHRAGPAVLFADSLKVFRLDASLHPETVRALTTVSGGEPVTRNALYHRDEERRSYLAE